MADERAKEHIVEGPALMLFNHDAGECLKQVVGGGRRERFCGARKPPTPLLQVKRIVCIIRIIHLLMGVGKMRVTTADFIKHYGRLYGSWPFFVIVTGSDRPAFRRG